MASPTQSGDVSSDWCLEAAGCRHSWHSPGLTLCCVVSVSTAIEQEYVINTSWKEGVVLCYQLACVQVYVEHQCWHVCRCTYNISAGMCAGVRTTSVLACVQVYVQHQCWHVCRCTYNISAGMCAGVRTTSVLACVQVYVQHQCWHGIRQSTMHYVLSPSSLWLNLGPDQPCP